MNIGDTVFLKSELHNEKGKLHIIESKIATVGRKYYTVQDVPHTKFKIEDNTEVSNYVARWKVYTSKQDILDEQTSKKLKFKIQEAFGLFSKTQLTVDQLQRIVDIIDE